MRLLIVVVLGLALAAGPLACRDPDLVVHEWGTFTTVVDAEGEPVAWSPLSWKSDLPAFVHAPRRWPVRDERDFPAYGRKSEYLGTVRMETPVIYFYPSERMTVDADVRFAHGLMTEWYPSADNTTSSALSWHGVELVPDAHWELPRESTPSPYYAARETKAAPLQIAMKEGVEREKLLFYRGVGTFDLPLRANAHDGRLALTTSEHIPRAIVFERRGSDFSAQLVEVHANGATPVPGLASVLQPTLEAWLQELLTGAGLYEDEAAAMIATWRATWFEEGRRVFFLMPSEDIAALLPLTIKPVPRNITRVLVGRLELISREDEQAAMAALRSLEGLAAKEAELKRAEIRAHFGRFTDALVSSALRHAAEEARVGAIGAP